jgi:hypothetical protein
MNETPKKGDIDVTKIVGIVSGAIILIALLGYFAFNDWIASQHFTGEGQYSSPVINQLPLLLGFIGTAVAGFAGSAVLTGKLAKKVEVVAEKTEKIEKQTNGRTHVRDAQIDALVLALSSAFPESLNLVESVEKAMNTARENGETPESNYSAEQLRLQSQIIKLTTDLARLNKSEGE